MINVRKSDYIQIVILFFMIVTDLKKSSVNGNPFTYLQRAFTDPQKRLAESHLPEKRPPVNR